MSRPWGDPWHTARGRTRQYVGGAAGAREARIRARAAREAAEYSVQFELALQLLEESESNLSIYDALNLAIRIRTYEDIENDR